MSTGSAPMRIIFARLLISGALFAGLLVFGALGAAGDAPSRTPAHTQVDP